MQTGTASRGLTGTFLAITVGEDGLSIEKVIEDMSAIFQRQTRVGSADPLRLASRDSKRTENAIVKDLKPDNEGPRSRLEPLVARFQELGDQPYYTLPSFTYLLDLEQAVEAEVDRMVVELREKGYRFTDIAKDATFDWRAWDNPTSPEESSGPPPFRPEKALPWRRWQSRYRAAVKRLRGDDEEILPLDELKRRRRQIERLETQLRVGPRPSVVRSADNQGEETIRAADLRRGDCIVDAGPRIVVRAESGDRPGHDPYVMVTYHDGLEYPYSCEHKFNFGREEDIMG